MVVVTALSVVAVMLVVVVTALSVMMVMLVVVMAMLFFLDQLFDIVAQGMTGFHCGEYFLAVEHVPGGSHDSLARAALFNELDRLVQLVRAYLVDMAEHNARRGFNLVVEKFAEVFHVHFALRRVHDRGIGIYFAVGQTRAFDRADNVGQLAHARRLDYNSVGAVGFVDLFKRL